jgi:hypothetical protein
LRELTKAPSELVTGGRFNHGSFNGPIARLNARDADVYPWLPKALKGARLKEWQAVQIGTERFFILVALFNAKTLAIAQVKVFDKVSGKKTVFEKKLSPFALKVPDTLMDSTLAYKGGGVELSFENRLAQNEVRVRFRFPAHKDSPRVEADLLIDTRPPTHQVVCQPLGKGRAMYSHKGQFPATGQLQVGDTRQNLGDRASYVLLDDHKGFYPSVMEWDWATGGGLLADGRMMGFNLTRNQALEPERYNENALWLDWTIDLLPPVRFERFGEGVGSHWTMRDQEGRVDLRFDVVAEGKVDINALIIRSKYRGPFGIFQGTLRTRQGETLAIDGVFGMGERFYLRS